MQPTELKFKVIIIGDSAVGKSSLAIRQCKNEFLEDTSPTIGAAHIQTKIPIDDKVVTLVIWDTAGQEEFAPLVPMYARKASCAIVVASVNNEQSLLNIDTWIKTLYESGEKPEVVVAINKFDLINDTIDEVDKLTKTFENKYDSFYFCSAKSGYNVKELFDTVAERCMNRSKPDDQKGELQSITTEKPRKSCC